MKKILKIQKGFTLIEVLVALTIFIIFITNISSSYLYIAKSQREANLIREIYSDTRYVFNLIADEARAKTIDYACYTPLPLEEDEGPSITSKRISNPCSSLLLIPEDSYLALIDANQVNRTIFKVQENTETGYKTIKLYKENYTGGTWVPDDGYTISGTDEDGFKEITLRNIKVNGLSFEISPLGDPFDPDNVACGPVQFQPLVSIYANIQSIREDFSRFKLNLQTSVSSRVYNLKTTL